jgi:type IV secretion system protein VirB2
MKPWERRAAHALWDLIAVAVLLGLPILAAAQTVSPFDTGARTLVTQFVSIATPVAILVVMGLGFAAILGRINWGWPILAVVGIVIIFGAQQLITWIQGIFQVNA